MAAVSDLPPLPPADDSWFKRHPGLGFLLAAALTFVIPGVLMVGLGTLTLIPGAVLTHLAAAFGGGLIVYSFCRQG